MEKTTLKDYERFTQNGEKTVLTGRFLIRIEPNGDFAICEARCYTASNFDFWGFFITKKFFKNGKRKARGVGVACSRNFVEYHEWAARLDKEHELLIDKLELDAPEWYATEFKKLFKRKVDAK